MRPFSATVVLAVCALAGCNDPSAPAPSFAAASSTDNQTFLIEQPVFVSCANGGAGENVTLSGRLHALIHMTSNDALHVTVKTQFQPQGITGRGEITGAKYQGAGVTQTIFTGLIGFEQTFVNNFRVIGQGPGNNFVVHENFHFTVNPSGRLTAFMDNLSAECR